MLLREKQKGQMRCFRRPKGKPSDLLSSLSQIVIECLFVWGGAFFPPLVCCMQSKALKLPLRHCDGITIPGVTVV